MKKIVIPINERAANNQGCIKLDSDVLAYVSNYATKSGWSLKRTASMILRQAFENGLVEIEGKEEIE